MNKHTHAELEYVVLKEETVEYKALKELDGHAK